MHIRIAFACERVTEDGLTGEGRRHKAGGGWHGIAFALHDECVAMPITYGLKSDIANGIQVEEDQFFLRTIPGNAPRT